MSELVNVTTQNELDKAVANGDVPVCRNGLFDAYDSAVVRAYDSAVVSAYGSAAVSASDSATVRAYGSATVSASGSATVRAYDSAAVSAYGSATVRAYGSATVSAYDSATVRAYDSAAVRASPYVAVHRFSTTSNVTGGVLIQIPGCKTAAEWLAFYGLKPSRGSVVLFKAVDENFVSGHGADYTPGTATTAPDFDARAGCGNGLHFSPRPFMAEAYHRAETTRFVACCVKVADIVVIDSCGDPSDKVKARSCKCLHEVDVDGEKIAVRKAVAA